MELLLWLLVFFVVNLFAYATFKGVDFFEKEKFAVDYLVSIKKCKWLFTRYTKESTKKDYIGKVSFGLQIINFVLMIVAIILVSINVFVLKAQMIRFVCFTFLCTYGGVYLIGCIVMAILDLFSKDKK